MNFASDNTTGAAPEVIEAVIAANDGQALPYGNDEVTDRVERKISEIFETDARVFLVATGTAANSLSLSVLTPSYGSVLCHWISHVYEDECGAPEFFTGGARLVPISGNGAKMDADELAFHAARGAGDVHTLQPSAVSVTQLTEIGTAYSLDELTAVSDICKKNGLRLHMDGARFANALVTRNCTPADMTWKLGVDILSFGGTKNGALAVEAVVIFDRDLAREFEFRRKRGGHLFSKMRLLAAQMEAYVSDDLWLRNARHANAMAKRLEEGLSTVPGVSMTQSVDGNMLFPKMPRPLIDALHADGFKFYDDRWEEGVVRLVTAFNTREPDVDAFVTRAREFAAEDG